MASLPDGSFELTPVGLAILSPDGTIRQTNLPAQQLLGIRGADIATGSEYSPIASMLDLIGDAYRRTFLSHLFSAAEVDQRQSLELPLKLKAGRELWVRLYSRRIPLSRDPIADQVLIITAMIEIPDTRNIEDKLILAREEESRSNRLKNLLLLTVNNELQKPVQAILDNSKLLLHEELTPPQQDLVKSITTNSHNIVEIIEKIGSWGHPEQKETHAELRSFSLPDLMHEIEIQYRDRALGKGLAWELSLPSSPPDIYFEGEVSRVRQILTVLIENAVRFTERGGISCKIEETIVNEFLSEFTFIIKDSGPGLSQLQQELFLGNIGNEEALYSDQISTGGSGLTTARNLAKKIGGQLYFESTSGIGTIFFLTVSFHRVASQQDRSEFSSPVQPSVKTTARESPQESAE